MSRLRLVIMLLSVSVTMVLLAQVHPYTRHERVHSWVGSPTCNPYSSFGQLRVDTRKPLTNRWEAFDGCRTPYLMASFAREAWRENGTVAQSPLSELAGEELARDHAPDGLPWENVDWARGRTVVAHGDSVIRLQLIHFCHMLGREPVPILEGDPFWPYRPEEVFYVGQTDRHHLDDPTRAAGHMQKRQASAESHGPRYCYIPELDFMYLFNFNFGLDTFGFFTKQEERVVGPYKYEDRMEWGTRRVVDHVQKVLGRGEPDLLFMGSALWDNVRWQKEDLAEGRNPNAIVSNDRIHWYKDRATSVMRHAMSLFPRTPIRWVGHHFPINKGNNGWFFQGVDANKRPEQLIQRLWRMTQAAKQAVVDAAAYGNVEFIPWGEKVLGTQEYQVDDLHQMMFPASYVWADMMLYELRRVVRGF